MRAVKKGKVHIIALIFCPECNKQVSDTAERCPKCGRVLAKDGIVLLHGFVKKTQKTPNREIETASNYLEDYQRRNQP